MKVVAIAVAAALLAIPAAALALRHETVGNAPAVEQPGWAEGVLAVVNLESRVYYRGGTGNENFYYRGDAHSLNEAIGKFASIKAEERRLVLLPGRRKTHSFDRKAIDFDWQFHIPTGRYLAATKSKHAVLTAYINAEKPRDPLDRKKAETWIRELDDDSFQVRAGASRELEKLGGTAKSLLRAALGARPSPEVRRRVGSLLSKLKGLGFDADDLVIPRGVTVVTASDLLREHFSGLKDTDPFRCALAADALGELAAYSDKVVPALSGMLGKGKNEYVRRLAASSLGGVGVAAKVALPALKEGLGDPDENVRAAFRSAVDQIEKAKDEPGWGEEVKKRRAILKDLDELKKARRK
jgi:HEAT repeats